VRLLLASEGRSRANTTVKCTCVRHVRMNIRFATLQSELISSRAGRSDLQVAEGEMTARVHKLVYYAIWRYAKRRMRARVDNPFDFGEITGNIYRGLSAQAAHHVRR
jgi:hypothetical protein